MWSHSKLATSSSSSATVGEREGRTHHGQAHVLAPPPRASRASRPTGVCHRAKISLLSLILSYLPDKHSGPLNYRLAVGAMPPGGMSHSSGDPGRLMKAASFTSRVRQAGVSVAARDNTHLRGNFARGLVTHLHADTAIIAHMPSNVSKLQWKVWQFFEDPNSSKAVRHLLPLSWRCARWPTPPRLQRACTPSPPVRLRRSISPSS